MDPKPSPVAYSPTARETIDLCEKKYFFEWLNQRRQGWRPKHQSDNSPLYQVYLTNKMQDGSRWAGSLFHQMMSYTFSSLQENRIVDYDRIRDTAQNVARLQFDYSKNRTYQSQLASKAPTYSGLSLYLVLSEHYHGLDDTNLLNEVQEQLDTWLCNTFGWEHWDWVTNLVRNRPMRVEIEPENRRFRVNDVEVSARMDLGIETVDGQFFIFDWKCQQTNIDFHEYQLDKYRRQLLTYAAWPIYRDFKPLSISNVHGVIFNPIDVIVYRFTFSENDLQDFEMALDDWNRLHLMMFSTPEDVVFDELSGPASPDTVCPNCQFQTICNASIPWHTY